MWQEHVDEIVASAHEPEEGRIVVDGYDIGKVELYSLRRQIGIVPQDPLLFSGTVSDNIALTNPEASSEEIVGCTSPMPTTSSWNFLVATAHLWGNGVRPSAGDNDNVLPSQELFE